MEPQRRRKRRNWCRMLRRFLVVTGLLQFGNSLPSKFLVFGAEPPSVEPERIWIETASGDVVTPAPNLPTAVCPDRGEVVFDESRESTLWGWMLCYPIKPADLKSVTLHVEGVTLSDGRRLRMPVVRFRKRSSVVISTGSPV